MLGLRQRDVDRRRELLADRARRQRARRLAVARVAFEHGDAAPWSRARKQARGGADHAAADDHYTGCRHVAASVFSRRGPRRAAVGRAGAGAGRRRSSPAMPRCRCAMRTPVGDGGSLLLMPAWSAGAIGVKLVTVMPQAAAQGVAHGAGQLPAERAHERRAAGAARRRRADGAAHGGRLGTRRAAPGAHRCAHAADGRRRAPGAVAGAGARGVAAGPVARARSGPGARDSAAGAGRGSCAREGLAAEAAADLASAVAPGRRRQLRNHGHRAAGAGRLAAARHPPRPRRRLPPRHARGRRCGDRRCERIVVDTRAGALAEAGDLVQPLARGVITPERIRGELAELLRGECAGRTARRADHAVQVGRHRARGPRGCAIVLCG